jgi:hypothetical protein
MTVAEIVMTEAHHRLGYEPWARDDDVLAEPGSASSSR